MVGGFGAEHKDARRKTQINRLSGDLQTLGQKLSRFFTGFALMQSARNLHRRIGQGRDFARGYGGHADASADQRA